MAYLRISEFAVLSGLSPKALRYYDELGVLKPAHIDAQSRYRLYSADQLVRANHIQALRSAGVPLAEIAKNGDARARALEIARDTLERTIWNADRSLRHINALLELDGAAVAIKQQPAVRVLSIRDRLSTYDDVEELFREIRGSIPAGIETGLQGALWHACLHDGRIDCEAFIEVSSQNNHTTGRASIKELPAATAACVAVPGGGDVEGAYTVLYRWLDATDHVLSGTRTEYYLPDAEREYVTEVRMPISARS